MSEIDVVSFDLAVTLQAKKVSAVCLYPLPCDDRTNTVFRFSELLKLSHEHNYECFSLEQNILQLYEPLMRILPAEIDYFRVMQESKNSNCVYEYIVGHNWGLAGMELTVDDPIVCDGKMGFVFLRQ